MNIFLSAFLLQNALFNSLDPTSLAQAFAYYELYPESQEGKKALQRAKSLLKTSLNIPIENLVYAVHRFPAAPLSDDHIAIIEALAASFPNRKLKGYNIKNEQQLLTLEPDEIDLSMALLIHQTKDEKEIKNYLALIDLMALQIDARLNENSSHEDKIKEMNRFIFQEMKFRFPPQSIFAKKIDHFTFLPSVMDDHIGVCLGVTTLYLALAQRLDLPLEIMTPPGHIYVRYRNNDKIINIETTARGINIPDEHYETIHVTEKLKPRSLKEVIGMTFINQASVNWKEGSYETAVASYEKAMPYLKDDEFSRELLAFSYIVTHREEKAKEILTKIKDPSEMSQDYLAGKVDREGIKAYFIQVDQKRESILEKQKSLHIVMSKWPEFRSGLEQMAVSYLQLHRPKEAISWLLKYHELDGENPLIEYYLALLHAERKDFEKAWAFLKNAEHNIKEVSPKALVQLKEELVCHLPDPKSP